MKISTTFGVNGITIICTKLTYSIYEILPLLNCPLSKKGTIPFQGSRPIVEYCDSFIRHIKMKPSRG